MLWDFCRTGLGMWGGGKSMQRWLRKGCFLYQVEVRQRRESGAVRSCSEVWVEFFYSIKSGGLNLGALRLRQLLKIKKGKYRWWRKYFSILTDWKSGLPTGVLPWSNDFPGEERQLLPDGWSPIPSNCKFPPTSSSLQSPAVLGQPERAPSLSIPREMPGLAGWWRRGRKAPARTVPCWLCGH